MYNWLVPYNTCIGQTSSITCHENFTEGGRVWEGRKSWFFTLRCYQNANHLARCPEMPCSAGFGCARQEFTTAILSDEMSPMCLTEGGRVWEGRKSWFFKLEMSRWFLLGKHHGRQCPTRSNSGALVYRESNSTGIMSLTSLFKTVQH